jgi:hypothetical protein
MLRTLNWKGLVDYVKFVGCVVKFVSLINNKLHLKLNQRDSVKLVKENISLTELKQMSEKMFGGLVKAVVDIEKKIMVVDAGMHADEETFLLENESRQQNLWGINLYPDQYASKDWIEFDSMINIRPTDGNRSRGIDDPKICEQIIKIVNSLVVK